MLFVCLWWGLILGGGCLFGNVQLWLTAGAEQLHQYQLGGLKGHALETILPAVYEYLKLHSSPGNSPPKMTFAENIQVLETPVPWGLLLHSRLVPWGLHHMLSTP